LGGLVHLVGFQGNWLDSNEITVLY
jgi:hypothetical protein